MRISITQTPSSPSDARVNLGYAQYQGTILGNGIAQYLGVRFAKAPVGDLRWRAPVVPDRVEGDHAADTASFQYLLILTWIQPALTILKRSKICLGIGTELPSDTEDEDCLFANVWAPTNVTADTRLPVWLFIPGGGGFQ